jgi:hypothetical protein
VQALIADMISEGLLTGEISNRLWLKHAFLKKKAFDIGNVVRAKWKTSKKKLRSLDGSFFLSEEEKQSYKIDVQSVCDAIEAFETFNAEFKKWRQSLHSGVP